VEIYRNGVLICDSRAIYGVSNSTNSMGGGGHHGGATGVASRHMTAMSGCASSDEVKVGDKFNIVVKYDFNKNAG
jgi:hypothetical protein